MANNFLRYKYFLISRASSEEIYIGIKRIFAESELGATVNISNSLKTALKLDMQTQAEALASLAEIIASSLQIKGENKLCGGIKLSDVISKDIDIEGVDEITAEFTQYGANNTGSEPTLNFEFSVTPKLMRQIYYPVITENYILGVCAVGKANNSLKTALDIKLETIMEKARTHFVDTLRSFVSGTTTSIVKAISSIATPIKVSTDSITFLPMNAIISLVNSFHSPPIKSSLETRLVPNLSLFRHTLLSDIDEKTLESIDGKKFLSLDLTQI